MTSPACVERVSVIIPCHNAAAFLDAAIDSVLAQTWPIHEIIIVDDGSTDGSGTHAAEASGRCEKIICVHQPNQGISTARNVGIAAATAPLLAFLDADDLWTPHSLAARAAVLQADREVRCVFGGVEQFTAVDITLAASRPGRLAGAMLVRMDVFAAIGLFNPSLRIGETLDWIARLDESGILWRMADTTVLRRRVHASNTVRDTSKRGDYLTALRAALARRRSAPPA